MGNMAEVQHCHNEFVPLDCKTEESVFSGPLLKIFLSFWPLLNQQIGFKGKQ
jgi:hypothetical protein